MRPAWRPTVYIVLALSAAVIALLATAGAAAPRAPGCPRYTPGRLPAGAHCLSMPWVLVQTRLVGEFHARAGHSFRLRLAPGLYLLRARRAGSTTAAPPRALAGITPARVGAYRPRLHLPGSSSRA